MPKLWELFVGSEPPKKILRAKTFYFHSYFLVRFAFQSFPVCIINQIQTICILILYRIYHFGHLKITGHISGAWSFEFHPNTGVQKCTSRVTGLSFVAKIMASNLGIKVDGTLPCIPSSPWEQRLPSTLTLVYVFPYFCIVHKGLSTVGS